MLHKGLRAHLRQRQLLKKGEAGGLPAAGEAMPLGAGGGEATPLGPDGEGATPLGAGGGEATPLGAGGGEAAPGTPEPVAEVPWPAAGVQVAVGVEHVSHALRLGETGVSEGSAPDDPLEVIVRFDRTDILTPLRIPRGLLVPMGAPMQNMRMWDKSSEQVKRGLLLKIGVMDPRDEALPSSTPVMLTLWAEFLPIGLRRDEGCKCKFIPPAFVKACEEAHEVIQRASAGDFSVSFEDLEDYAQRQELRQKLLREWWAQNEVLLVCMCDEATGTSSLLALRKTPMSVRYYEAPATKLIASCI